MASNRTTMSTAGRAGALLGYEDEEHAQILTAIRQPLFIQTPLQAMLESLVEKLQVQSGLVTGLQEQVNTLERTNLNQQELLDRVRVLESRLEVSHGPSSALSPFNQQEVLNRLQVLEQKAEKVEQQMQQLQYKAEEEVAPRLRLCESRLVGVHNLAGRLMAVDLVASELGIAVPHPELMTRQQLQQIKQQLSQAQQQQQQDWPAPVVEHQQYGSSSGSRPGTGSAAGGSSSGGANTSSRPGTPNLQYQPQQQQQDQGRTAVSSSSGRGSSSAGGFVNTATTSSSRPGTASSYQTGTNSVLQYQPQQQTAAFNNAVNSPDIGFSSSSAAASRPQSSGVGAGVLTRSKQAELQQQIDAGKEQMLKLQQQLEGIQQQAAQVSSDVSSSQDSTMDMLAGLQDTCQGLSDRLSVQVVQLRKEMAPALQQAQQSSVSISDLAQIQTKLDSTLAAATAATKDVQQLKTKDLPVLNTAIADLGRRVGPLSVTAVVSDADKALAADVAGLRVDVSGLAVRLAQQEAEELARQGVATKEDMQELSRLMVSKANKDDMRAVLGRAVELALEAYRSSVGDADNSGASRTRCLVCERQLVGSRSTSPARDTAGSTTTNSSTVAAVSKTLPQFASFRPASAAAAYTPPAAASETLGFGPMGPGLNAAQLRRLADQKRPGTAAAAAGDGGSSKQGRDGSSDPGLIGSLLGGSLMVKSSQSGQSNPVIYSNSGPYDRKQQQQQQSHGGTGKARPQTTGGIRVPRNHAAAGDGAQQAAAAAAGATVGQRPGTAVGVNRANTQQQQGEDEQQQQQQDRRQPSAGKRNPVFV